MVNGVLHNPQVYTNGYSVCVFPLCILEMGVYKNVTMDPHLKLFGVFGILTEICFEKLFWTSLFISVLF